MNRQHRLILLALAAWLAHPLALSAAVGPGDVYAEWDFTLPFDNGTLWPSQASSSVSSITLSPGAENVYSVSLGSMYGNPRNVLFGAGTTDVTRYLSVDVADVSPTAGYSYVNAYTLVWNVYLPSSNPNGLGNWYSLYNSNEVNANKAEIFVRDTDGALGTDGTYYGTPNFDQWVQYAVTVSPDPVNSTLLELKTFINGVPHGSIAADGLNAEGRYSLYSSSDPLPTLLLFADNEGANYNDDLYMSGFAFVDRALSANEIAELGDPNGMPRFDRILTVVPEPGSCALAVMGACGLFAIGRRRKQK